MICQNCQTNVDNDLVFCTNCGTRLNETWNQAPSAFTNDSVITKASIQNTQQKSNRNLKWIALIVALIVIPASLFGGYLLLKSDNQLSVRNTNSQNVPTSKQEPPTNSNQNNRANMANTNLGNAVNQSSANPDKTEIMNERIEIAPGSHYALPFKVDTENAKFTGDVKVLGGESIEGYVYFQEMYDQHFPDPVYKVFSFDVTKDSNIEQTLVKENYVLVFVNKNAKSSTIQGKFTVEK